GPSEPPTFRVEPTFGALLAALAGEPALVAVDIPIGLPSGHSTDDGRRRCDGAARALLGPRAVSVFPAPCRPTLSATSYRDACQLEISARQGGSGLSRQAYGILPK